MNKLYSLYKKLFATKARKQLVWSLVFNFVAKLPGLISVFIILPEISRSLGSEDYGRLLAAIGLGTSFCFPLEGLKTVGRRQLAMAYGAKDRTKQAQVFMTVVFSAFSISVLLMLIVSGFSTSSWPTSVFVIVSLFPIIGSFLNTFDSIRAAFNEHYITAKFQLWSQLALYGLVILIGIPVGAIFLSGVVMQPYAIASLATMLFLIFQRKYLLFGKIKGVLSFFRASIAVTLSNGIMTSLMGYTIYWLSQYYSADYAAWVGTIYRLFTTFVSPLMLVLFPLTSFISIHWADLSLKRKQQTHYVFILFGLGFGAFISCLIGFAGPVYIEYMFDLPVKGSMWDVVALSLFLGAIVAQKIYTMLIYSFCEGIFISYSSTILVLISVGCAAFSHIWLTTTDVVNVMFVTIGFMMPLLLAIESMRQQKELKKQSLEAVLVADEI